MKEQISSITGLTINQVNMLLEEGLIEPRNAVRFCLCADFKELKAKNPNIPNSDIYFDLAERHRVSESTVYKWVNNYKKI